MTAWSSGAAGVLREHRPPTRVARTVNRLTSPDNGPPFTLKFHLWLYKATDGRLGHGLIGAPTLLLGTIGRRTGQWRITPVVYVRRQGQAVIGATNGGLGRPGWFHNLLADPYVEIQIGRQRIGATASVLYETDPDYEALWHRLDQATNGRYSAYESRSGKATPLVVLVPDTGAAMS